MGKHLDELSLRRAEEKKQEKDSPHTHCEEWMDEIDASLEENAWHSPVTPEDSGGR